MKKIFFSLPLMLLFFISCVDESSFNTDKETNPENIDKAESLITTVDYQVPVVEGFITTVSYNGVVLARTSTPISIKVPKTAVSRGDDNLSISYSEGRAAQSYSNLWQTIMFEDAKIGDYDYNDLVVHVNYQIKGSTLKVAIHPIALGSSKTLKLRFKWTQGGVSKVVEVAENCREELFGNEQGFVNTRNYDLHYSGFVKEYTVELPNAADAVDVSWFIMPDENTLIYAVNQNADKCIDDNGMPYGFALTDVTNRGADNQLKAKKVIKSLVDAKGWEKVKPDVSSWASMPAEPAVPVNAIDMANVWNIASNANYVVKEGATYEGGLGGSQGAVIYVKGTLKVTSMWGSGLSIVVLKGGTIVLPSATYQNITILNYGTMKFNGNSSIVIDRDVTIKTMSNIEVPNNDLYIGTGSLYCAGDVEAKKVNVTGKAYMNSLKTGDLDLANNGLLYVNGSITANNIEINSGTEVYADCAVNVSKNITISNKTTLSVKGHISAEYIDLHNNSEVNIMSGGLIEATKLKAGSSTQNRINVVGPTMGVLAVNDFDIYEAFRLDKMLTGNLGVVFTKIYDDGIEKSFTDLKKLPEGVVFNSNQITLAPTECLQGGYNTETDSDNGIVWFAYPLEGVNINTCYDFESWKAGNITFEKLSGAKVFDINNDKPLKGEHKKIYEITK